MDIKKVEVSSTAQDFKLKSNALLETDLDHMCLASYCLTNYPTVLDIVLSYLSAKQLCAASRVCWFWNDAAEREKTRRKNNLCLSILKCSDVDSDEEEDVELSMNQIGDEFQCVINNAKIFPSTAILFVTPLLEIRLKKDRKELQKVVKRISLLLPSNCPLSGCQGTGVVGFDGERSQEYEFINGASLLLLPLTEHVEVRQFFLKTSDMKKAGRDVRKWRNITNFDEKMNVKLILMHAACEVDETENAIEMILKVTGKDTVIAGGNSTVAFFDQNISTRGISCMCFAGDLRTNLVVNEDMKEATRKQNMLANVEKLKQSVLEPDDDCKHNTVMFMYSCCGRGLALYGESNVETSWIAEVLPDTPIMGVYGIGEIGYDSKFAPATSTTRNYLSSIHSYSTVLCLCRFSAI
eukprot:gene13938-15390_t